MKTRAIVLRSTEIFPAVEELEIPVLLPGQVLVKMAFSGICHTQLSEIRGRRGLDRYLPHVLGHEGSGYVEAVGPGVKKVGIGQPVVVSWVKGSGAEVPSTQYHSVLGTVNAGAVSSFMEYAVISENRLTPISADMPLAEAALLGCAILTGAGAVKQHESNIREGHVAVFGVGGIGTSAIMQFALCKPMTIIAVDLNDCKLEFAKRLGATHLVNASNSDVRQAINDITKGKGLDCAFEAAGVIAIMEMAFACVRDQGGLAILAGNPPFGEMMRINPYDLIKGKRIIGTAGGETYPDIDIPYYVKSFLAGEFDIARITGETFAIDQFTQAIEYMERGKPGRVLLSF